METANRAFPKELNFTNTKPLGHTAKPAIIRYRSDNTSYKQNDLIRIELNTGRNGQYLFPKDSFIEGKVQLTGINNTVATASSINIDQSVFSLFSRITVTHGSVVVEDCVNTNRLWTALNDIQINNAERQGQTLTHLVQDSSDTANGNVNNGTLGKLFFSTSLIVSDLTSDVYDFSFVIPSGVLGSLASKALPLGLMNSSSLYLELELAPFATAFVSNGVNLVTTNTNYTVSEIYYNAKVATLDDNVNRLLTESFGGSAINLPAVSYKTDLKTIGASVVNFSDKFAFQYSSLKNFLFFVYKSASGTASDARSISSRPKANISEYYLTINGEAYPTQPIQNQSRMYSELLRSFDGLTDTNFGGIINYTNYNVNETSTDTLSSSTNPYATIQKRFIAGIDLDRFNHSSDVFMSGSSSIGQMVNLNLNFSVGNVNPLTLIAAVQYDVIYRIENGQMTHKF